jgi:hypothetical protein
VLKLFALAMRWSEVEMDGNCGYRQRLVGKVEGESGGESGRYRHFVC